MTFTLRYRLQPYANSRRNRYPCPRCGEPHQFTRWVDTRTGEQLPPEFGICNHQVKCGYERSPYETGPDGHRYVDQLRANDSQRPWHPAVARPMPPRPVCTLPEELLQQSLGGYARNQFARLLQERFGAGVAAELLARFEVGTSAHWPGATVFWQRDPLGRVRGGQVVLFEEDGHTAKRLGADGCWRRCTTWVHTVLAQRYRRLGQPQPTWLTQYLSPANDGAKSPSLYGLRQLTGLPLSQPLALVEAPKTAIICAGYFPTVTWLAVGSLGQLTAERLLPLRPYGHVTLYPDASATGSAYQAWARKAAQFNQQGHHLRVCALLEEYLTPAQQAAGYDLADVLLTQWAGYPPSWDTGLVAPA